jgi:hypothetical protein
MICKWRFPQIEINNRLRTLFAAMCEDAQQREGEPSSIHFSHLQQLIVAAVDAETDAIAALIEDAYPERFSGSAVRRRKA